MARAHLRAQAIDDVLLGTFPASDPPSWTPVITRPAPEVESGDHQRGDETPLTGEGPRYAAPRPTVPQALVSLLGATGLVLLLPVVVLAIGTPLALAVRGLLEAARWLLG